MTMQYEDNNEVAHSVGVSKWWIAGTALITILICSIISWILIAHLSVAKSVYASDITSTSDAIGHLQDATDGLNNYASYQNSSTQTKLDTLDSEITGINNDLNSINSALTSNDSQDSKNSSDIAALQTSLSSISSSLATANTTVTSLSTTVAGLSSAINDPTTGLAAAVGSLSTTVSGISSLNVIPTVSYTAGTSGAAGTGTISMAIESNQSVASQTVAFDIELNVKNTVKLTNSIDSSLQWLYTSTNQPVTLYLGNSTTSTAITPDHITYNLYWNPSLSLYCLGSITFSTPGTSIANGTQTKTLTYTSSAAYDVVVTPKFESATNSSGGTISTW